MLYGESLGTGVAVQVAAQRQVSGVVLEAPYTSMADLAKQRAPFLPVDLLLIDRYETLAHLKNVRAPVLVMHGEQDSLIPVEMGRRVYAHAHEPKRFVALAKAGHNNQYAFGAFDVVQRWLSDLHPKPRNVTDTGATGNGAL